jgi:ferredoxin-NADP reductase
MHADGQFELVVKRVPDGIVSGHLHRMEVGQSLLMSGPGGRYAYLGGGIFAHKTAAMKHAGRILCICAGSGITPIYAVLRRVLLIDNGAVRVKVLYVNKTVDDVILRAELDEMCPTVECHYSLTQPLPGWSGLVGRPSVEMVAGVANPERDEVVLICGSTAFNLRISDHCLELGYDRHRLVLF